MRGSGLFQLALPLGAVRALLANAGGQDQRRLHALFAALLDDPRRLVRRNGQHRQVHRSGHLLQCRVAGAPAQPAVFGVDRIQFAFEAGAQQVAEYLGAEGSAALAGAEYGDAAGCEQGIEVMGAHAAEFPAGG